MGFRINRGIFQFKDPASDTFINKFKIDERGEMVEVDPDGNVITTYMRLGDKSTDADLLDGVDSSAFIRSNAVDTASSRIDFTADESIRLKGIRGQFANEYIHLYNKVGIGHPSGWGQGNSDTPSKGLSTYGGANFAYGDAATSSFKGSLRVDVNWGANEYPEQFTIRGTYPSIALRSTTHNSKWLIHNDNQVSWYYGSELDTDDWALKFRIATNGNIWMQWAGGWLSDLLNAKEEVGAADAVTLRIEEEILPAIDSKLDATATAVNADTVDGYHATNAAGGLAIIGANSYWYPPSWINVGNTGIYSSRNNAHFLPNNTSPHGSWEIIGSRGGWSGIYFRDSGNTLMANANDSGFYNKNAGWQMEWFNGSIYLSKQANGGGTLATVIDSTTIGSQSVDNADKLDGYHSNQLGNRDFTKQGFYVDGDENTYYPVVIGSGKGRYGFNRYSITRHYSSTAPWDPIGTGNHKGGLTFDFYWSGDTNWGGNHKPFRVHEFGENYTTMVGGIALARTGGMVVWLRGGHAYYELHCDALPPSITVYLEGFTDGSGGVYDPTDDVNQHKDTIWNNWPVRNSSSLYIGNRAVATEQWTDDTFLRTTENAATATTATNLGSDYTADDWFRATGDNNHVKFYGNSRQMLWRTDGTTEAYSGIGGYPFVWNYNGSGSGNRIMILHTDGRLWTSRYGWLDTAFDAAGAADAVNLRIEEEILPAIDGKLGATAKAADSNLLDGIDSSAFIRENQDRRHKVIRFTGESGDSGNPVINYGIYQEGGAWTHPYPDLVIGMHTGIKIGGYSGYNGTRFYNDAPGRSGASEIFSVGNGDSNVRVTNNLHIGSAGGWITDLLNAKATTGDVAGVDARINDELLPQITTNADNIARNATDIATKLGTTGKAADSNLLDGVDSSRFLYGGNSTKTTNISNVSTALASGFYDGYNITGTPTNTWYTYINMRHNNTSNNYGSQIAVSFYNNSDMFVRTISNGTYQGWSRIWNEANLNPSTLTVANAGYATNAGNADAIDGIGFRNTGSNSAVNADSLNSNGITYYTGGVPNFSGNSTDGALYSQIYSSSWQHQIAGDYRSGQLAVRGKNNNSWQPWRTILDSSNFTSFIPAATAPVQATVEGGNDSTLVSIAFSPGEGAATFTLADGQSFRLAFAR